MVRRKSIPRKTTRRRSIKTRRRSASLGKRKRIMPKQKVTRPPKRAKTSTSAGPHHSVMLRPFSSATTQPKIPDGEFTTSLSRRMQNVVEIQNAKDSASPIVHLVLAPTYGIPLTTFNSESGKAKRGAAGWFPDYVGFPNQTVGIEAYNKAASGPLWPPPNTTDDYTLNHTGGFSKWRIVSQALRLELVNSDEENDGWYEACRFNWPRKGSDLCLTPVDGTTTTPTVGFGMHQNWAQNVGSTMAMVEQPGYKTGLLKDLKKLEFTSHHLTTKHEGKHINLVNDVYQPGDIGLDPNSATATLIDGSTRGNQLYDQFVDSDMDFIYIRLHCRTNATGGSSGSRFLANLISNVEVNFDPTSDFSAFQTINKKDKRTDTVMDGQNNVPDAHNNRPSENTQVINKKYGSNLDDPPELVPEDSDLSRSEFDTNLDLRGESDPSYWSDFIRNSDLATFKAQAYINPDGISIRINPVTGYKELFIAGTRSSGEWIQNIAEGIDEGLYKAEPLLDAVGAFQKAALLFDGMYADAASPFGAIAVKELHNMLGASSTARDQFSDYIDALIKEEGVEVVYGHSRGAAIMSGLHSPVKKVGVDGATFISHHDMDFINLVQGGDASSGFDSLISTGYAHNVKLTKKRFHDVTREKPSKRARVQELNPFKGSKLKPTKESKERVRARRKKATRGRKSKKRVQILDKVLGRKRKSDKVEDFESSLKTLKRMKMVSDEDYQLIEEELKEEKKSPPPSKKRGHSTAESTDHKGVSTRKKSQSSKKTFKRRKGG